jgi:aspartate/methionine/tyrosine aminotransferase
MLPSKLSKPDCMFSRRTNWQVSPNRLTQAQEELRAAGRELLDLTESNPTRVGLHYDAQGILQSLLHPKALEYHPDAKGLLAAREAVAAYYRERDGTAVDPAHILLTTSTSEAYTFLFRLLCEPGDEVLVPAPSYPLFSFLADLQDVRLVPYPLFYDHAWHVDMHSLEKAVSEKSRAVLAVNPNNPTGSYVAPGELQALDRICAERELALVADEVFLDFSRDGSVRTSCIAGRESLAFCLSGLSKISALPQMKVAWLIAGGPRRLVAEAVTRLEVIADTYLSMNAPIQLAVPELLQQRHAIQRQLMERIRLNLSELDRQLAPQSTYSRLTVDGGWYAVLRIPVTWSDEDFAIELLEREAVLVYPGHFYDFPRDGYIVISLITQQEVFREGMQRMMGLQP